MLFKPDLPQANREHKDSVFTLLFGNEKKALELYSAISGKDYPENTEIEIITLSGALYKGRYNDIAFVIEGKLVVLIEHQSTVNENMPLRMLVYIAKEYEKITKSKDLYRRNRIKIPAPEFIVLYNGPDEFPDYKEMRLSDSFAIQGEACFLELSVKVYNISKGRNSELSGRSSDLSGYSELIAEINENLRSMELQPAITLAIKSCIGRNILVYFLERYASEVVNMLLTEWNWDDALAVAKEEGIEIGKIEGKIEERQQILDLFRKGYSLNEVEQLLTASPQLQAN